MGLHRECMLLILRALYPVRLYQEGWSLVQEKTDGGKLYIATSYGNFGRPIRANHRETDCFGIGVVSSPAGSSIVAALQGLNPVSPSLLRESAEVLRSD